MSESTAIAQGELDGLCGIYALTKFLRDRRIDNRFFALGNRNDRSNDAFWMLLDSAYRLNMLTPDYLIKGYAPHHLVRIWNTLSEEADLQATAVLFSKLRRLGRNVSIGRIAECVLEEPNSNGLVILYDEHWYLGAKYHDSGNLDVFDSRTRSPRKRLSKEQLNDRATDGFALLADQSTILKCIRREVYA